MSDICPKFESALSILSKRWVGLIIYQLLEGSKRFSDLEHDIHLSAKVLSERLKQLEQSGIIQRDVYPDTPVRIEYSLTDKGRSMKPVLDEVSKWADTWVTLN